jgi:hypothetical protein
MSQGEVGDLNEERDSFVVALKDKEEELLRVIAFTINR